MNVPATLVDWLANGERGVSSNTIVTHLTGIDAMGNWPCKSHPLDPDDLHRCRLLLERCPELLERFPMMGTLSPIWKRLVEEWGALCVMLDEEAPEWRKGRGSAPKTYERMKALGC